MLCSVARAHATGRIGRGLIALQLPLSFLATYFALDFSDFKKVPSWVHLVICESPAPIRISAMMVEVTLLCLEETPTC